MIRYTKTRKSPHLLNYVIKNRGLLILIQKLLAIYLMYEPQKTYQGLTMLQNGLKIVSYTYFSELRRQKTSKMALLTSKFKTYRECPAKTKANVAIFKDMDRQILKFLFVKGSLHNLHKTPSAVLSQPSNFCLQMQQSFCKLCQRAVIDKILFICGQQ